MFENRRTAVTVDLNALADNARAMKRSLNGKAKLMAVVKADAYGHGLVMASKAFLAGGADALGVAVVEEGMILREAGVTCPVLVLGNTDRAMLPSASDMEITVTVHHEDAVQDCIEECGSMNKPLLVHLKVDSGMSRIGFTEPDRLRNACDALQKTGKIHVTGAFTHLCDAENEDAAFTSGQLNRFRQMISVLPEHLVFHAANSAASLNRPDAWFSMVRGGIVLYGYPPVTATVRKGRKRINVEKMPTAVPFTPAFTFETEVAEVKTIPIGTTVGYGRTWTAARETRVATIAVGYGDGYLRANSNRASVLIAGKRCPVIGNVCMDQTMVDVTDAGDVKRGDAVVLIGRQGMEAISPDELAAYCATICYEVLLSPTARVPKRYLGAERIG